MPQTRQRAARDAWHRLRWTGSAVSIGAWLEALQVVIDLGSINSLYRGLPLHPSMNGLLPSSCLRHQLRRWTFTPCWPANFESDKPLSSHAASTFSASSCRHRRSARLVDSPALYSVPCLLIRRSLPRLRASVGTHPGGRTGGRTRWCGPTALEANGRCLRGVRVPLNARRLNSRTSRCGNRIQDPTAGQVRPKSTQAPAARVRAYPTDQEISEFAEGGDRAVTVRTPCP
jgi:hypothetical protein